MKTILWMEVGLPDLPGMPIKTFSLDTDGYLFPLETTIAYGGSSKAELYMDFNVYWHIADMDLKVIRMMVQSAGDEDALIELHGPNVLEGLEEAGWVEDNTYYAS